MNCPACSKPLKHMSLSGIALEACDKGCGGVWFDGADLTKVNEAREAAGEMLLDVLPHQWATGDPESRRYCTRCMSVKKVMRLCTPLRPIASHSPLCRALAPSAISSLQFAGAPASRLCSRSCLATPTWQAASTGSAQTEPFIL